MNLNKHTNFEYFFNLEGINYSNMSPSKIYTHKG